MESLETDGEGGGTQCVMVFQLIHTLIPRKSLRTAGHILFIFDPMTLFYRLYCIYFSMRKRRLYIFNKVNLDLFHVCRSVAAVALVHVEPC